MQTYANISGKSNVKAFQEGEDYIIVEFQSGKWTVYTYTFASAGSNDVERMKALALQGVGLNSYIGHNKPVYASRR